MRVRTGAVSAIGALTLAWCILSGCDLPVQQSGSYGSGGQAALPDMAQSLTGVAIHPFSGLSTPGANDRNFTH